MENRFVRNPVTPDEQRSLRGSRILVTGCGGLGGYVIEYLARLGVGHIVCADDGTFQESDMNRQLLSEPAVLGKSKAICAKERVLRIAPGADVQAAELYIDATSLPGLLRGCDLAVDALDNTETRKALYAAASQTGVPVVHAAVSGWWAQAAYVPPGGTLPHMLCREDTPGDPIRVMPFTPGLAAAVQAAYAARCLLGYPCDGDLHVWNLQTMEYKRLQMPTKGP